MKRLLVVLMVCCLILTLSAGAFGKSYGNIWNGLWGGDFSKYEIGSYTNFSLPSYGSWYYIGKIAPYALVTLTSDSYQNVMTGGQYYKNDQTYAEYFMDLAEEGEDCQTNYFKGSYKLDNGIFFGFVNFSNICEEFNANIISLGYSVSLKNDGYIALSTDYASSDDEIFDNNDTNGSLGYAVDFRYYTDKARFYGQLYASAAEVDIDDFLERDDTLYYQLGVAYQVSEPLVIGVDVLGGEAYGDDISICAIGGTYGFSKGELNARYIYADFDNDDRGIVQLLAMFDLDDNLKAGPMYTNSEGYTYYSLYGIYSLKNGNEIRAAYDFPNEDDDIPSAFTLLYKFNLK